MTFHSVFWIGCIGVFVGGCSGAYDRNAEQDTFNGPFLLVDGQEIGDYDIGEIEKDVEANRKYGDDSSEYIATWLHAMNRINTNAELKADWKRRARDVETTEFVFGPPTFTCDVTKSNQVPTSVHELRPGDIRVISAMGDSLSAGYGVGAEDFGEVFRPNRGESWSVGGDLSLEWDVITLSNVLRKFNPDLLGYSTCVSLKASRHAWLNVALGGATNTNMPTQASSVINLCNGDESIDVNNDWKLITLFIGGNDLCRACSNDDYNSTNYAKNIKEALDRLHNWLPRSLVNLVPMFDITPLANFSDSPLCDFIQPLFCPCGILPENSPSARPNQLAYYNELKALVDSGRYDTRDDFTVVLQPMFVDLTPPIDPATGEYDRTFLSHDCFHPSRKAHQIFAYMLWNTMLIKDGEKPLYWDLYEENPTFYCPTTERPYIYTRKNSD